KWRRAEHADIEAAADHGIARGLATVEAIDGDVATSLFEQVLRLGDHADVAPRRVLVTEIKGRRGALRQGPARQHRGERGNARQCENVTTFEHGFLLT